MQFDRNGEESLPRVLSVYKVKSGAIRMKIFDGEEHLLSLCEDTYCEIGMPGVGDLLDEGSFRTLLCEDERRRALQKALLILGCADKSEYALAQKLLASGFSRESVTEAVHEVVRLGYLDEARQIRRQIELELSSRISGPRRLLTRLAAKGFSSGKVRDVLSEMTQSGEIDFAELKNNLLASLPEDADDEEKKKILYKNGF